MSRGEMAAILTLPHPQVPSTKAQAVYRGEFLVDLEKLEVAATLPLHAGATFQDRAYRMVIDESTSAEAGQSLRVRTSICSLHVRSTAGTALLLLPAQQTY
jgi:hypothetical protein